MSEEINATIRTMFASGHGYQEIAGALGVTRNAVAGKCYRLGLVRNPDRKPRAKKDNSEAVERKEKERDRRDLAILAALDGGKSQQTVARQFDVSQSVVWHLAKAAREAA
jgi:hypothetical protein